MSTCPWRGSIWPPFSFRGTSRPLMRVTVEGNYSGEGVRSSVTRVTRSNEVVVDILEGTTFNYLSLSFAHTLEQMENDELIPQANNTVFSPNTFVPDGLDEPESYYSVSGVADEFNVTLNVEGESFDYHIILHRIPLPVMPAWNINDSVVQPEGIAYQQENDNPYRIVDVSPVVLNLQQPLNVSNSFNAPFDWNIQTSEGNFDGESNNGQQTFSGYDAITSLYLFAKRNGIQTWPLLVNNAS